MNPAAPGLSATGRGGVLSQGKVGGAPHRSSHFALTASAWPRAHDGPMARTQQEGGGSWRRYLS